MPIRRISDFEATWNSEIVHYERAVIFFYATWSPPDKILANSLERLMPNFEDKLTFFSVDIDKIDGEIDKTALEIWFKCPLSTTPSLVMVKHGKFVQCCVGHGSETEWIEILTSWTNINQTLTL